MNSYLNYKILSKLESDYGDAFYICNTDLFEENIEEFLNSFKSYYPNTSLGYSYKTNYLPHICKKADQLGAYAEIVSEMELEIVKKLKIKSENVIYNGPNKTFDSIKYCLLGESKINIDNISELDIITSLANQYHNKNFKIGIRINFDLGDDFFSRFGFDVNSHDFGLALNKIAKCDNLKINGLHYHSTRPDKSIKSYINRLDNMIKIKKKYPIFNDIEYIDIGGGFFGKMDQNIKNQFNEIIPTFEEYGKAIASRMREEFPNQDIELILEPGVAMTVNVLDYVVKVKNIKSINGQLIATVSGSFFQVKPTKHSKNLTLQIYSNTPKPKQKKLNYKIAGYTCLESDFLHYNYVGFLSEGDYLLFKNVGAYTIVFNPPFIKLAPPIISIENEVVKCVRDAEKFENIFHAYLF